MRDERGGGAVRGMMVAFFALLLAWATAALLRGQTAEMVLLFYEVGIFGADEGARTQPPPRVLQSETTASPAYLVELADYGEPTHFELWSTPLNGSGQRRRISQPTSGQGWDVATGFVVIQNGAHWRAVYVLSQIAYGVHDLYAVNVDGGSPSLVRRLALPPLVKFGSDEVTFAAETIAGGAASWWISNTVQATSTKPVLFADGFENGGRARWN